MPRVIVTAGHSWGKPPGMVQINPIKVVR